MAKDCSFDIVSEFDKQELVNTIDQTKREVQNRYDLKSTNSQIDLDEDKTITITTNSDMALKSIYDIMLSKAIKRGLSIKIFAPKQQENAAGSQVRQIIELKKGLSSELAKRIVSDVKNTKLKIQASIQGEQVRITGKNKDDLQDVIKFFRENEDKFDIPLQFTNYR